MLKYAAAIAAAAVAASPQSTSGTMGACEIYKRLSIEWDEEKRKEEWKNEESWFIY